MTIQVPENKVTTMYAMSTGALPEFLAWIYEKKKSVIALVSREYCAQAQFLNTNSERR